MKFENRYRKVALFAVTLILMSVAVSYARTQPSYTFKVHNTGKNTIKKLLASEDGKSYANFDIGDGIAPGETATLVWDHSTDNGQCAWYFKAEFDDGAESAPVKFDFCEKDLLLEIH
jgi:hypothetical protein